MDWRLILAFVLVLQSADCFELKSRNICPLCPVPALKYFRPNRSTFLHQALVNQGGAQSKNEDKDFLKVFLSYTTSLEKKRAMLNQAQEKSTSRWGFLDSLLLELDSKENTNWIASIRYPIPLPSYRVKLASLRRLVDFYVAEDTSAENEALSNKRSKALASIINQLTSTKGGIFRIEKEALKTMKGLITMEEMLARTPKLETPQFSTIFSKESEQWEVRQYNDFSVVSLDMEQGKAKINDSTAKTPGSFAFNFLAGYIFGKNQEELKMEMTTPVISTIQNNDYSTFKDMSFVMPSRFWGQDNIGNAPTPLENFPLSLKNSGMSSAVLAVKWFGGFCSKEIMKKQICSLEQLFESNPDVINLWEIDRSQNAIVMQYNDPFQPPWKKRNEVAFLLKSKKPVEGNINPDTP